MPGSQIEKKVRREEKSVLQVREEQKWFWRENAGMQSMVHRTMEEEERSLQRREEKRKGMTSAKRRLLASQSNCKLPPLDARGSLTRGT